MMVPKMNNKGSALVSVLVITAFITIISTMMLYISSQNYRQKQTDYENKQSFYEAEKALDYLKACLVSEAQEAYKQAYTSTMQNYLSLGSPDKRKEHYQRVYIATLVNNWQAKQGTDDYLDAVKKIMGSNSAENSESAELANRIYSVDSVTTATGDSGTMFVVKGVKAKYTYGNYTTFLYTDISLGIPPYESIILDTSSSNVTEREVIDLSDYVVYMNWRRDNYDED